MGYSGIYSQKDAGISPTVLVPGDGTTNFSNTGDIITGLGFVKDAGISVNWDKGASFIGVPENADCELKLTLDTTNGTYNNCFGIVGFAEIDSSGSHTDLVEALQFNLYNSGPNTTARRLYIYNQVQTSATPYLLDVYKVKRTSGEFKYYRNDTLIHTSLTINNNELLFDCSINQKMYFKNITLTIN